MALYTCNSGSTVYYYVLCLTHCVKSVQIRSFLWSVFSCIRTEYRKIRTRKNSVFKHFIGSDDFVVKMKEDFTMKVLYCLIVTSLAITQLNFMLMGFVINQRRQQVQQNWQLIQHIMMKKKTVHKTARRSCWVKKVRTGLWWDKFLTNQVQESEWRDNFRMSKRSFYE